MNDGSTTDPTNGQRALGIDDLPVVPPTATSAGYCAGCGTWDAHGRSCTACGYDFSGTQSEPRD